MSCLFCDIVEGKIPAQIVKKDDHVVVFRDIQPQAPTHVLVVPTKHISTINDLTGQDAAIIGKMVMAAQEVAVAEGIDESGYRMVLNCNKDGGQSVFHIHLHLLGGRTMQWPPG
ncbi:histidine triad nucleotide-binding protein [candidate division KSB1 bacterium]|nr:histidine triad nucleotide-binding protein [candidate division KSB1 bacterium]